MSLARTTRNPDGTTTFRDVQTDRVLAYVYPEAPHRWYVVDEDGDDLPGGWQLPTRDAAERAAAAAIATTEG